MPSLTSRTPAHEIVVPNCTTGPWFYNENSTSYSRSNLGSRGTIMGCATHLAIMLRDCPRLERCCAGNARLMAAAPELYDCVEDLVATLGSVLSHYEDRMPEADCNSRWALVHKAESILNKINSVSQVTHD